MKAARFDYCRPADLREAVEALGTATAKPLSGGQSLGPMLNLRLARPGLLVDVGQLPELQASQDRGEDGLLLGAGTTHAAIEDGRLPDPTHGVLARVARGIAYRAVRNRGTIGGSLAHADPAADWPTTLTALGAAVLIAGPGAARQVPIAEFIVGPFETALGPQEIVTGVLVPRLARNARWGYWKACRKVGEFADAMAAVLSDPDRGVHRIVIGATEGRAIVVTGPEAEAALARPETLDARLADALGDEGDLHRAALRYALAALQQWVPHA